MKIIIHELAAKEFNDSIEWYELQSRGLGRKFKKAVVETVNKVKKNPTWYLTEEDKIFKVYIPGFPFKILYTINDEEIIIWAISHLHRKPWYWQNRRM